MIPKQFALFTIDEKNNQYAIGKEVLIDKKDIARIDRARTGSRLTVITDPFEYQGNDQVLPIQPEQIFFLDEVKKDLIKGARVLEIGLGSGILSIFSALEGAREVVGLDINSRAKNLTGFNAVLNGVEDILEIRDGSTEYVFKNVAGEKFDYIISNPPFEPTPPGMDYYMNSSAGIYGLDFLEMLLKDIDSLLTDDGSMQFVTMAPGDKNEPFLLRTMLEKYFPGKKVDVVVDTQPIGYSKWNERFIDYFGVDKEKVDLMNSTAEKEGVTDIHMCMIHYKKDEAGEISFTKTGKVYETWDTPLGA